MIRVASEISIQRHHTRDNAPSPAAPTAFTFHILSDDKPDCLSAAAAILWIKGIHTELSGRLEVKLIISCPSLEIIAARRICAAGIALSSQSLTAIIFSPKICHRSYPKNLR